MKLDSWVQNYMMHPTWAQNMLWETQGGFSLAYPGMRFCTQVLSFIPGYEIASPGMKLLCYIYELGTHTRVQNSYPGATLDVKSDLWHPIPEDINKVPYSVWTMLGYKMLE
jgi:hypothetical protein